MHAEECLPALGGGPVRAERLSVLDRRAGHRRKPRVDIGRRGVHCHRRRLAQLDELRPAPRAA